MAQMKKCNYGYKEVGIDEKRRIIIPAQFAFNANDTVVFCESQNSIYLIYLLAKLDEIIEQLKSEVTHTYDANVKRELTRELNKIFEMIKSVNHIDSQRRLVLPDNIINLVQNNKVILQGRYDHISLYANNGILTQYQNEEIGSTTRL